MRGHSNSLQGFLLPQQGPVLNEAAGCGGVKTGEVGGWEGERRNVTPRAKRNDEGHLQESLNFPSRAAFKSQNYRKLLRSPSANSSPCCTHMP